MAGKIYINGATKDIVGGKIYVNGQVKNITHGKVYVNWQIKTISFGSEMPNVTKAQGSSVRISSDGSFTITKHKIDATKDDIEYSFDNNSFSKFNDEQVITSKKYNDGYAIYIRNNSNDEIDPKGADQTFKISGSNIKISGDSRNLIMYSNWGAIQDKNYALFKTFAYNTSIVDCSDFNVHVYDGTSYIAQMFYECTNLKKIPMITFNKTSYNSKYLMRRMFYDCTSLSEMYSFRTTNIVTFNGENSFGEMYNFCPNISLSSSAQSTVLKNRIVTPKVSVTNALYAYAYMYNSASAFTPSSQTYYYTSADFITI